MFEIVKQLPDILVVRARRGCSAEGAKRFVRAIIPKGMFLIPIAPASEAESFLQSIDLGEIEEKESVILYEEFPENYDYLPPWRRDCHHVGWLVAKHENGMWTINMAEINAHTRIWKDQILVLRLGQ